MSAQPELKDQCRGRWRDILLAAGFSEKQLSKKNGPCPFCDGETRWRWTDHNGDGRGICSQCAPESADGIDLYRRMTGLSFADAAKDIRERLGDTQIEAPKADDTEWRRANIRKAWCEALALAPLDPVHRYLALNRGLRGIRYSALTNIRYHPALYCAESRENHPAMLAMAMTPEGRCGTLHRTYLTMQGDKADVPTVKKLMPTVADWSGGCVRLGEYRCGGTIVVGEGIESTLAYALRRPDAIAWPALDAVHLARFVAPAGARVIVAADNDASYVGQSAGYSLARRLHAAGHDVEVMIPPTPGTDWADAIERDAAGRAVYDAR